MQQQFWSLNVPPTNYYRESNGSMKIVYCNGKAYCRLIPTGRKCSTICYDGRVLIEGIPLEGHDKIHHEVDKLYYSAPPPPPLLLVAVDPDTHLVILPLYLRLETDSYLLPVHPVGCCANSLLAVV